MKGEKANRSKRMGRPPMNPKERKSVRIGVNVTEAEAERIRREAGGMGMGAGDYLRHFWLERRDER